MPTSLPESSLAPLCPPRPSRGWRGVPFRVAALILPPLVLTAGYRLARLLDVTSRLVLAAARASVAAQYRLDAALRAYAHATARRAPR